MEFARQDNRSDTKGCPRCRRASPEHPPAVRCCAHYGRHPPHREATAFSIKALRPAHSGGYGPTLFRAGNLYGPRPDGDGRPRNGHDGRCREYGSTAGRFVDRVLFHGRMRGTARRPGGLLFPDPTRTSKAHGGFSHRTVRPTPGIPHSPRETSQSVAPLSEDEAYSAGVSRA